MKALCCFGRHSYGVPSRGLSPEYVAFVPAIESLGYTVELFDSLDRGLHKSYHDLNVALLNTILELKPDLFFCVHLQCEIWTETLIAVRNIPNIKMVAGQRTILGNIFKVRDFMRLFMIALPRPTIIWSRSM